MSSQQFNIPDCKVEVRKYVLISQPSRWRQKGERVVVQSPMLKIPRSVLVVPVKRYNGEEQNSVCFIPKEDIERDTSYAYDNAQINKATSWVESHGVALFDSSTHDQISYQRGDRFWICIGASTNGYNEVVPVINLQTFEKGDIRIDKVCWYPKIQGPNQELWTLGGETRQLKRFGSRNFSYWSWVICQRLDGSLSTTKTVEIPAKEVKMEDRLLLSSSESRSMFKKIYRCMTGASAEQGESRSCSPPAYTPRNQTSVLPTPPASPDQPLVQRSEAPKLAVLHPQQHDPPRVCVWRRIFDLSRMRCPTNGQYILRNSLIHPQEIPQSHVDITRRPLLPSRTISEEEDSALNENALTRYSKRESSSSRADAKEEELFSHDLPSLEGSDLYGAALLVEICRKEKESLAASDEDKNNDTLQFSASDPDFYKGTKSIREEYNKNISKLPENPILTARCNLKDPQCKYTRLSTQLHYHCPPLKCTLSQPSTFTQETQDNHDPNHEHCISQHGPYPDSAGSCHLQNSPLNYPSHICCYWTPADLASIPQRSKMLYDDRKLREAKRRHMQIHDRRAWIGKMLGAGEKVTIRDCEAGKGGRWFLGELRRGRLDGEVRELREVYSNERLEGELGDELGL